MIELNLRENRKMKRFKIAIPALIEEFNGGSSDEISLVSRDISAHGAFFLSPLSFPVGTGVKVKLFLLQGAATDRPGFRAEVNLRGSVIRIDEEGVAVQFEKKYEIFSRGE